MATGRHSQQQYELVCHFVAPSVTNHTFIAYAVNDSGNPGKKITNTFSYVVWSTNTINITGSGTIVPKASKTGTPALGTNLLQLPGSYYFKTAANPGYLLSNFVMTADPIYGAYTKSCLVLQV